MDKEQLLYNYFSNSLSPEEEKLFQDLLRTDADFKDQFNFEKNLKRVIKKNQNETLKSKLIGFEKEIDAEKHTSNSGGGFKNWSVAATIALLMGLGWVGYNAFSGTNYNDLYNDNFETYPNTVYTITRSDGDQSLERNAFAAYEAGDYDKAITTFLELKKDNKIAHVDFYLAQSYLNLEKNEEAITLFKKVIADDIRFKAEANWYLALIYLKNENELKAISTLEEHIKNYEFNRNKAVELLEALS